MSTLTNPTRKRRRSQAQILVDEARVFLERPTMPRPLGRSLWQQMVAREQRLERAHMRQRRRNRTDFNRARRALTRGLTSATTVRDALGARPFTLLQQFGGGAWQKYRSIPLRKYQFDYYQWVYQQSTQLKTVMMRQLAIHNNYRVFAKASANVIDIRPVSLTEGNAPGDNSINMERLMDGLQQGWIRNRDRVSMTKRFDLTFRPFKDSSSIITNELDVGRFIVRLRIKMVEAIEKATNPEDGTAYLQFEFGNWMQLEFSEYHALAGASHVKLPQYLEKKSATINVQNNDVRCMEYALVSALHRHELPPDERNS